MTKAFFLPAGRTLLALGILFIGVVHLVAGHFPTGLIPVKPGLVAKEQLAYVNGVLLILSSLLILFKKYRYYGIVTAGLIFLIILLLVDLPLLAVDITNGGDWAGTFEAVAILCGISMLYGMDAKVYSRRYILVGRYAFIISLVLFGVLHCIYRQYIGTLIPDWLPANTFFGILVIIAFFGAAMSFLLSALTKYTALLLAVMFMIWFIILHMPRALSKHNLEPEWTSAFVALAMSGIALLAGASFNTAKDRPM